MGVKGLTTYLKEYRRHLSHTRELKSINGTAVETIEVIVDGWSLLHALFIQSGEPWAYGGEYLALSQHARNLIAAWIQVGFRPLFVFDGPTPPLKYPTVIARTQASRINPSNLFFRTSQTARSTHKSLSENCIAPPLAYAAVLSTLLTMEDVDVKFAEGEADPYIMTLAGELHAYVVAKDSDFVVLNAEGYRGYIPLDELIWSDDTVNGIASDAPSVDDDFGFQTVFRKKKQRKQARMTTGLIPPTFETDLVLLITIYEPSLLASHMNLPLALLPLLGALIGNDYASLDFFRSTESVVERVQRVASTLSSVWKDAQSNNAKKVRLISRNGGGAMDVIGTTIERLLLWRDPRNTPENRDIDRFTDTIIQSTLEYAVGTTLFPDSNADTSHVNSNRLSLTRKERVRNLYRQAYHQGVLHFRLMEAFFRGVCFPTLFLEDPDKECVSRSIGRPIRNSIWQLFVAAGGIPEPALNKEGNETPGLSSSDPLDTDDEEELIDVIEEDSDEARSSLEAEEDPLTVLQGRIQRMSFSENKTQIVGIDLLVMSSTTDDIGEEETEEKDELIELPQNPKILTEYLRKGVRATGEEIQITDVEKTFWYYSLDELPVQLRPLPERITVFLQLLGSDTFHVRQMILSVDPFDQRLGKYFLWVVAYRWILQTLHARCEDADSSINRKRLREEEKWTQTESEAFFRSLCFISTDNGKELEQSLPPLTDRAIQLTAQLLAAFEAIVWLAQALLLMTVSGSVSLGDPPLILGEAEKIFSGRQFHAQLQSQSIQDSQLAEQLKTVADEGLAQLLKQPKEKKVRKGKAIPASAVKSKNAVLSFGRFGTLVDLDDI